MNSWKRLDIEPASIPHLLHWDLAYLWALEQQNDQLSALWQARVEGWSRLLALFVAGQLQLEAGEVPTNLKTLLAQYSLQDVWELRYKGKVLGILSPTTIVRPLPDFTQEDLLAIPGADTSRHDAVTHLLALNRDLLMDLRDVHSPIISSIIDILGRELLRRRDNLIGGADTGSGARAIDAQQGITLLKSYDASGDSAAGNVVKFQVYLFSQFANRFVPVCDYCQDRRVTLQLRNDEALIPKGEHVTIDCAGCGRAATISLGQLYIASSSSDRPETIVWTDRDSHDAKSLQTPPPPVDLRQGVAKFEWSTSETTDPERRFLNIRLDATAPVRGASLTAIFYDRFLDAGGDLNAAPIRGEWAKWLTAWPKGTFQGPDIIFENIEIVGIPGSIRKLYPGSLIRKERRLGVALYPSKHFEGWSDYRSFLTGDCNGWQISTPEDDRALIVSPALVATKRPPRFVAVEDDETGKCGALWRHAALARKQDRFDIGLGIDFGTTSTVVAYRGEGKSRAVLAEQDILAELTWLVRHDDAENCLGSFVPLGGQFRSLFPSAIWFSEVRQWTGIRWSNRKPNVSDLEAKSDLKWVTSTGINSAHRTNYLYEVLYWSIPAVMRRLGLAGTPSEINLGVAFPLAFTHGQRESYRISLKDLEGRMRDRLGVALNLYTISESEACVKMIGAIAPEDLVLVADMGGGSLDLAVVGAPSVHSSSGHNLLQIGSIRFGGEVCIKSLAGGSDDGKRYWQLRDSLASPIPDQLFASDQARMLYSRHEPRALEIVRAMAAAATRNGIQGKLQVFLAGNGWRLSSVTNTKTDPQVAFLERFDKYISAFGLPSVSVWKSASLENPKHVVALGALENALSGQARELQKQTTGSKLPSGRTLSIDGQTIEWWELIGSGGLTLHSPDDVLRRSVRTIHLDDQPEPSVDWKPHLRNAVPPEVASSPSQEAVRQRIVNEIENGRLGIGPLQVIIEDFWSKL